MIRAIKAGFGLGIVVNGMSLASTGASGATNERTLGVFFWFLIAYVIADTIKDALDKADPEKD
jgi:uncharacterized membrane protein YedE/YeeE